MSLFKGRQPNEIIPALGTMVDEFIEGTQLLKNQLGRSWNTPPVNIHENETEYLVELAAPGLEKENFKIFIENGMLKVSAEIKEEQSTENDTYSKREFVYTSFNRSFWLPENTSEENTRATYERGILKISMEKKKVMDSTSAKVITVN